MTGSSDESDYTDVDELAGDAEYVPSKRKAPAASNSGEFRIQCPLKPYRNVTYTTSSLVGARRTWKDGSRD
jgi:hypothetical protein